MEHFKFTPTNPSQPQQKRLDAAWLAERIALIFTAYRKDDYSDPEAFMAQVGMNLERYPMEVVEYVTAPTTGIQTRCKFPPSLAEIVEACNAEQAHLDKVWHYSSLPPPLPRLPASPRQPMYGDGGPGTIYTDYEMAMSRRVHKGASPFGPFDQGRQLVYEK